MKTLGKIIIGATILVMFGAPAALIGYLYTTTYVVANDQMILRPVSTKKMLADPKVLTEAVMPIMTTSNIADIAEEVGKSVVSITTTIPGNLIFDDGEGLGSGIIFKQDETNLYILTNAHVLEDAVNLVITSPTLGTYKGEIIGIDTHTDIAVVSIPLKQISHSAKEQITLAKIDENINISVGDIVLAIGSPLDKEYYNSVTLGVISALNRQTNLSAQNSTYIQTDTAINPGNSGGPLTSVDGYVIGLNTAKLSSEEVEGIGFAIPITEALPIATQIIARGGIERAALGVYITDAYPNSYFGNQASVGALVEGVVPGGSADQAGIEVGDVIVKVNNDDVSTANELIATLSQYNVRESVSITLIRGSRYEKVKVILQSLQ